MWQILIILALTLAYFVMQEMLRRCRLSVMWGFFFLAPLVLTPFWIATNDFDPFPWIKIYSLMFCVSWGSWLRFTPAGDKVFLRRTILWLLAANIVEALALDVLGTGTAHNLNAVAGILLLATMPWSARHVQVDRASRSQDIRCDLPLGWIVGYTLWNLAFVYLNYPELAGHHVAVLSAALILARLDRGLWVQARAASLGLHLLLLPNNYAGMLAVHDATGWVDRRLAIVAAAISCTWLAVHALTKLNVPELVSNLTRTRARTAEGLTRLLGAMECPSQVG
jgi:hypothetical protein